jgi:indole-3-acetate monooxygenase
MSIDAWSTAALDPVEGGYELQGRWPFLTGVLDASWAAVLGIVHDGDSPREHLGGPDVRLFYVPSSTWCVEPTWDTATAMRGTGSHAISIAAAMVPEGLTANIAAPLRVDRPLFRLPLPVGGPPLNAAIALGIARRGAQEIIDTITDKGVRGDGSPFRDRERNQLAVAAAVAETRLLRDGLVAVAAEVWQAAQSDQIPLEARASLWASSYVVIDRCRMIVSDLAAIASSSFYTHRNPVESAVRDLHAICASIDALRPLQEDAGRVLLGLEPLHPMF